MAKGDILGSILGGNQGQAMTGGGTNPLMNSGSLINGGNLKNPRIPVGPPNGMPLVNGPAMNPIMGLRPSPTAPPTNSPTTGAKIGSARNWGDRFLGGGGQPINVGPKRRMF